MSEVIRVREDVRDHLHVLRGLGRRAPMSIGFIAKSSLPGESTWPPTDFTSSACSSCQSRIITGRPIAATWRTITPAVVDLPDPVIPMRVTWRLRSSSWSLNSCELPDRAFTRPSRMPSPSARLLRVGDVKVGDGPHRGHAGAVTLEGLEGAYRRGVRHLSELRLRGKEQGLGETNELALGEPPDRGVGEPHRERGGQRRRVLLALYPGVLELLPASVDPSADDEVELEDLVLLVLVLVGGLHHHGVDERYLRPVEPVEQAPSSSGAAG